MMTVEENISLSNFTSFGVGGPAERIVTIETGDNLEEILRELNQEPLWILGYGTNVLISDNGLSGTTLLLRNKQIDISGATIIAEAGALWDDVVKLSIDNNLWGIELSSGIPGSVGAGLLINANAYGHGIKDRLDWVDVWIPKTKKVERLDAKNLTWEYKKSIFQTKEYKGAIIIRASFTLQESETTPLTYQSALDVAEELDLTTDSLTSRRAIILTVREQAASVFVHGKGDPKTAGSFFRNPTVTEEQAEKIIQYDETGKTREQIKKMNLVHGGDTLRVSAAHVMFAAGFSRGQSWGNVRLHPTHVLKLENTGGATTQEIHDVAMNIIRTIKEKLDIIIEPEVRILGDFN